jgi:Helicase associated domain
MAILSAEETKLEFSILQYFEWRVATLTSQEKSSDVGGVIDNAQVVDAVQPPKSDAAEIPESKVGNNEGENGIISKTDTECDVAPTSAADNEMKDQDNGTKIATDNLLSRYTHIIEVLRKNLDHVTQSQPETLKDEIPVVYTRWMQGEKLVSDSQETSEVLAASKKRKKSGDDNDRNGKRAKLLKYKLVKLELKLDEYKEKLKSKTKDKGEKNKTQSERNKETIIKLKKQLQDEKKRNGTRRKNANEMARSPAYMKWKDRFDQLVAFYKKFGHHNVSNKYDCTLNDWTNRQRAMRRRNDKSLTKERIEKLDGINFPWKRKGDKSNDNDNDESVEDDTNEDVKKGQEDIPNNESDKSNDTAKQKSDTEETKEIDECTEKEEKESQI